MNVSELRLGGLIFDHHHVSCFRRDELRDGGGGDSCIFCSKRKPLASLNRDQNLATMTAAWAKPPNSPKPVSLTGSGSGSQHPAYF